MESFWDKDFAVDVIYRSMKLVREIRSRSTWKLKADGTLLTEVDPANEEFLRRELCKNGELFIGEESIEREGLDFVERSLKARTWVVDPIDGTAPFAHHLPTWAISAGYMVNGVMTDGVFILPDLNQCFVTDGPDVLACFDVSGKPSEWQWHTMEMPEDKWNPGGMITLGQGFTRHGNESLPNPTIASGSAVHALSCVVAQNAIAYIGSGKIWDLASVFPMLFRLGYSMKYYGGNFIDANVATNGCFILDAKDPHCWGPANSGSFVCSRPKNREIVEKAIVSIG